MPQPSQGSGKDPSQKKRTRLDPVASMINKTKTPAVQAATATENAAKKIQLTGLRETLEGIVANIEAGMPSSEKREKRGGGKRTREQVENDVAVALAKRDREEKELKGNGNSGSSSGQKKQPKRKSSGSSEDKNKGNGSVKK